MLQLRWRYLCLARCSLHLQLCAGSCMDTIVAGCAAPHIAHDVWQLRWFVIGAAFYICTSTAVAGLRTACGS